MREIYTRCAVECVTDTPAFKDCMQLLKFQSQVKLIDSIKSALKIVNTYLQGVSPVKPLRSSPMKNNLNNIFLNDDLGEKFVKSLRVHLLTFLRQIENANTDTTVSTNVLSETDNNDENVPGNRYKLKEVRYIQNSFSLWVVISHSTNTIPSSLLIFPVLELVYPQHIYN